jgi:hypothetical protein
MRTTPLSRARAVGVASALTVASLGVLSACSGGTPSATPKTTSTTSRPGTTTPAVAACSPSAVAASISFTKFGGTSSTLAGAVVFRNTSSSPCALHGVPRVQVVTTSGRPVPAYQEIGPANVVTAVLTPAAPAGTGTQAASSITFSSWTCATSSFSLTVRFPGWESSVPAAPNATSGTNSTTPCSPAAEKDQTVYMGSVAPVAG